MLKSALFICLAFISSSFSATHLYTNNYVSYQWPVSTILIADSTGSGDTRGHSFSWPTGPVGCIGTIIQHIDPVLYSSPQSWAYDEALADRNYFEADTFAVNLEVSFTAYFDTVKFADITGYIMGNVFKFWDDPIVFFQETRYFGFPSGYGVEVFIISDTADIFQYYESYDSVANAIQYTGPAIKWKPQQVPFLTQRKSFSWPVMALKRSRKNQIPLFDIAGKKSENQAIAHGIYYQFKEKSPK